MQKDDNEGELVDPEADEDQQIDTGKPIARSAVDSLRICIFCNKELKGVKKCLDHMMVKHGFFIVDVDCCTKIKGLLNYIAERVHLGQLCLLCSKHFISPRRCQQHMIDKQHCFINQEDEHEYEEFYDFSKTYENHPDLIGGPKAIQDSSASKTSEGANVSGTLGEDWEDVDLEDAAEEEIKEDIEAEDINEVVGEAKDESKTSE